MKMLEVQGGFGLGAKGFSVIVVFDNAEVFNSFVNQGWEFGGQAIAAAKMEDKGGAMQGAAGHLDVSANGSGS
jgi:lipid-binding SYLF domain-containing protein